MTKGATVLKASDETCIRPVKECNTTPLLALPWDSQAKLHTQKKHEKMLVMLLSKQFELLP